MGARRGNREGYSVSGSGGFHRWFVVGATAGRGRDNNVICRCGLMMIYIDECGLMMIYVGE